MRFHCAPEPNFEDPAPLTPPLTGSLSFNAKCADDLAGWSYGVDFDIGEGLYGSAGPSAGLSGSGTVGAEIGAGFGASASIPVCVAKKMSCTK